MFPKRGQVWTYRERGRFLTFMLGIPLVLMLVAGIYFMITESNWTLILVTILGLMFLAMFLFDSERKHRGEP